MKKLISVLLIFAVLLSFTACAADKNTAPTVTSAPTEAAPTETVPAETTPVETEPAETETPATEPAVVSPYPMTLTDQADRAVTLAEEPQRIVSGYYISTSALIALGVKDRLVGIEAKANKRAIYKLSAPELIELPNVGTAKEFDLEGCIALKPDLVILPIKLKNAAASLEELDIPVLLVNPESQTLLFSMVDLLAAAVNAEEKAAAMHDFVSAQDERLSRITGEMPRVYMAGNSALLSTAGSKMYQSDMITLACGENVAAELTDTYWADISYEQLLTWDPEYIVLASDATYTVEDVLNDPNLANVRAVREGKVIHMPSDLEAWDSPIPGGVLGSVWLASMIHSDEITAEEATDIITAFYEQFYGFTYEAA